MKMNLTVLNVAYPFAPIGPDAVGGAEQILSQLDAALVRGGHRSIALACEGSVASGILTSIPRPAGPLDDVARQKTFSQYRAALETILRDHRVDVVHLHGVDFYEYLPP